MQRTITRTQLDVLEDAMMRNNICWDDVIDWRDDGERAVRIYVSDGMFWYDYIYKATAYIPNDREEITEDAFKAYFGIRLSRQFYIAHITQCELAERVGISEVMISRYINGQSLPTLYVIYKIAQELGCTIDDLIFYK